jgi:AcrR family transcriptional regulator
MGKRMQKGTLSRDAILETALRLADREGLDAVTIRALATALGASPMSIYGHFADKDALYDAMRGAVVAEVFASADRTTWQAQLEQLARGFLQVLRGRPRLLPLLTRSSPPPETVFEVVDRLAEMMEDDGFTLQQVLEAYMAAMSFGVGLAIIERTTTGAGEGSPMAKRWALMASLVPHLPRARRLSSIAAVTSQLEGFSFDAAFDLGLRSLISNLEARIGHAKKTRKHA